MRFFNIPRQASFNLRYTIFMDFFTILLTSIALSFDSFTISLISGTQEVKHKNPQIFKLPFSFAVSHIIFISLGWFLGVNIDKLISSIDHWIAFSLLMFVGGKMLIESIKKEKILITKKCSVKNKISNNKNLFPVCIATSIDAFAVGLSFAFLKFSFSLSVIIVFSTIFFTSLFALFISKKINPNLNKIIEILGGLILIFIGLKILLEHIF